MLETRAGTEWQRIFDGTTSLIKIEDGSRIVLGCLNEFQRDAILWYREVIYTGRLNMANIRWRESTVQNLADIANKMAEEGLIATLSQLQTIEEVPDREAFLNWYTEGKGGFEELFYEARTPSCGLVPFTIEADSAKPVVCIISANPTVKLRARKYFDNDFKLELLICLDGQVAEEWDEYSWQKSPGVSAMFHHNFLVDGKAVNLPNTSQAFNWRKIPKAGLEKAVIQGHVIISEGTALTSSSNLSFLTESGLRSADCVVRTSNNGEVLFHRVMLETREGTEWQRIFDGTTPLCKNQDGSKSLVTSLKEFSQEAVLWYREIVYGQGKLDIATLKWRKSVVQSLAEIANKMGEEGLIKTMCSLQTIAEVPDREAFLEWCTLGKGGFEELFYEARMQSDADKLKQLREQKRKRDRSGQNSG
ncbi:hypothetical protein KFL_000760240 [Klebsormidium nitens]|uniref:Uncharacterized protein n=1 Tax=Klebsormidium nitens TaxID=105231 RepID=A0A1Y1HRN3_KLENI|nr:hypothetical protein KFL_000760240 [Klebsormidium nitens]|eukprot:GAQ81295.1 hypothetical protein KFL_000760240 [Klebsormidium nitens]